MHATELRKDPPHPGGGVDIMRKFETISICSYVTALDARGGREVHAMKGKREKGPFFLVG